LRLGLVTVFVATDLVAQQDLASQGVLFMQQSELAAGLLDSFENRGEYFGPAEAVDVRAATAKSEVASLTRLVFISVSWFCC
jgi:hypothetical protein